MKRSFRLVVAALALWIGALLVSTPHAQVASPAAPGPHAGVWFASSDNCLACHNGLTAPSGEDVSIGASWRASMMANAARDPYWQAGVRREILDHPAAQAEIEDECSICHMPMARTSAVAAGGKGTIFRLLDPSHSSSAEQRLAVDGVSCALCHQIGPERLGTRESFVGGFVITSGAAPRMGGPFEIDPGRTALMRSFTGAEPAQTKHIAQSEVCATCHTLFTQSIEADGTHGASLPEQVPYLEWRHSAFREERSCQACHMPPVEKTAITSVLGEPRDTMSRHTFFGGNFFMLRMLNRFRDALGVVAPPQELDASAHATIRQLQADTATVAVTRAAMANGALEVDLAVRNLAGHKFPTGYPSRRTWLHLRVRDAAGATVFESGAIDDRGRIAGNDNDADALAFEPHYQEIRRPDEVQIYEAVMVDSGGRVTTGLLRAVSYVKDNRLLPRGFDKGTADGEVAVRGGAVEDADFTGGGDRLTYRMAVDAARGPFTVDAVLRYQTISFRWAENLRSYNAPEPKRFLSFWDPMASASSVEIARTTATAR